MKSEQFAEGRLLINSNYDWKGRYYIAHKPYVSRIFRDRSHLVTWLTADGDLPELQAVERWLDELVQKDLAMNKRQTAK